MKPAPTDMLSFMLYIFIIYYFILANYQLIEVILIKIIFRYWSKPVNCLMKFNRCYCIKTIIEIFHRLHSSKNRDCIISCTCSVWAVNLYCLDSSLLTDISLFCYPFHVLSVELWETCYKSVYFLLTENRGNQGINVSVYYYVSPAHGLMFSLVLFMVLNATFSNISVISWLWINVIYYRG